MSQLKDEGFKQYENGRKNGKSGNISYSIEEIELELNKHFNFRNNTIKNQIEVKLRSEAVYRLVNENSIYRHLHLNGAPVSMSKLKIILGSNYIQEFNPIVEYFNKIEIDYIPDEHGDYIAKLLSYCSVENPSLFLRTFKYWMVSAINTILNKNELNKTIYVLFNSKQNSGKTTFVRSLFPEELKEYVMENQLEDNKDGIITLSKAAFHILDEMEALEKIKMQSFKSMVSKDKIDIRPPYGVNVISRPRITSFIGTSDRFGFLKEDVGTSRFIVQEVKNFDFNYSKEINSNILWSHAYFLFRNNYSTSISKVDKLKCNQINQRFIQSSIVSECIKNFISPSNKQQGQFMQTNEIIKSLNAIHGNLRISDRKIGLSLNALGFERVKHFCKKRKTSLFGYYVKLST